MDAGVEALRRRARARAMRVVAVALAAALACVLDASAREITLLKPGDAFPKWSLVDETGKAKLSSQDLAGKRYLLWFFKADTIGGKTIAQGFRDHLADFEAKGVTLVGVSFDPPAANASLLGGEHPPFRLLSDGQRSLGLAVGVADLPRTPAPRRVSYLVGPDGKVERVYPDISPLTHPTDVLADLH
jgi:peroxiredoxin Q/BCP